MPETMKYVILQLCLLLAFVGVSQTKSETYDEFAKEFLTHYNAADSQAFHGMFDSTMKALLPQKETADLLATVRSNFGSIQKMDYYTTQNAALVFRTFFEKEVADIALSLNKDHEITALFIPRNTFENSSVLKRNATKMIFPFKEEAFVYWGGKTVDINYHMADMGQQYAFDILMVANGAPYQGDPSINESYFVYGKDIIAPCDAKVVKVINGIKDNTPGELNKVNISGNTLILETARKEYLLFAHLKENSIACKEGDVVKQGQLIAQCGNSGNTYQAHLHFQLQNTPDLFNTMGAQLYFDEIMVNGELRKDYMPKKEDFVSNAPDFKE